MQTQDRSTIDTAQAAVKVADVGVKEEASHEAQDGIAEVAM
jgi:hypothetical protein